jgi:hypothetical protein
MRKFLFLFLSFSLFWTLSAEECTELDWSPEQELAAIEDELSCLKEEKRFAQTRARFFKREADRVLPHDKTSYRRYLNEEEDYQASLIHLHQRIEELLARKTRLSQY